jgi:hypothetical protein
MGEPPQDWKTHSDRCRMFVTCMLRVSANPQLQTKHLQEALAACGWEEAANLEQQDTSEAFSFITEKLELPLLTLKMDIFHTGKEDDKDDHKFVQERLLEVAVPDDAERERPIRLEDCLESYFNNQVEVVRRLERSNTRSSVKSARSPFFDKSSYEREWSEGASTHVEVHRTLLPRATHQVHQFRPAREIVHPV